MAMKKISEETKSLIVNDNDYLLLVTGVDTQSTGNKIVSIDSLKKHIVETNENEDENEDEFITLESEDKTKKFRVYLNDDGQTNIIPEEAFTSTPYAEGANLSTPLLIQQKGVTTTNNTALVINQIYGAGSLTTTEAPISHNFIELYNNSLIDINLNGLYLFYKDKNNVWDKLKLRGIVPAKHSFLIRGSALYNINSDIVRVKIKHYDQEWNKSFSDKGFSAYLCIGEATPEETPVKFSIDESGSVSYTNKRWIDCIGAGGPTEEDTVPVYEGSKFNFGMDLNHSCRRIKFFCGNGNNLDTEIINYKTCDINRYRPRSLKDGVWDSSNDEIGFDYSIPNMVNMTLGEQPSTRIFTFQTKVSEKGYVKYKKIDSDAWIIKETDKTNLSLHNNEITLHKCIIKDLDPGDYNYKVGFEGCWTDEYKFKIKEYSYDSEINIYWTTDEQGWTEKEYSVCNEVVKCATENGFLDNVDFHLNTGDISQNADRFFEWKYYFDANNDNLRTIPHMTTCGNNDLIEKKYGTAFTYYSTYENEPLLKDYEPKKQVACEDDITTMLSTYAFDLGFTHFVCLNSNTEYMYEGISTEEFLEKQNDYLDKHLTEIEQRETKPRWVIVYMHLSPFTIVRTKRLQKFIPTFEKHQVDLVLCGHNHTYSKSIPLKTGYNGTSAYNDYVTKSSDDSNALKIVTEYKDDNAETKEEIDRSSHPADGVYYLMLQATGVKLTGKEKAITLPEGLEDKNYSSVGGNRPWWYGYNGQLPVQPCFSNIKITNDKIVVNCYYIKDLVQSNTFKEVTINKYDSSVNELVNFDTLTINYADRDKE